MRGFLVFKRSTKRPVDHVFACRVGTELQSGNRFARATPSLPSQTGPRCCSLNQARITNRHVGYRCPPSPIAVSSSIFSTRFWLCRPLSLHPFALLIYLASHAMDPSKAEGYRTPPSPPPSTAPPHATAIPATSLNQVLYPPTCPAATATLQVQPKLPTPWSTGLFDCCDDVGNCMQSHASTLPALLSTYICIYIWHNLSGDVYFIIVKNLAGCVTCFCPCVTFGQIAEIVDKGSICKSFIMSVSPLC